MQHATLKRCALDLLSSPAGQFNGQELKILKASIKNEKSLGARLLHIVLTCS